MKIQDRNRKRQEFAAFIKKQLTASNIEQDVEASNLDCKSSTFRGYLHRNAFPQHVAIDLYLRYASKKLTPEDLQVQPRKVQERLTRDIIRKIESQFSITWCDDRKQRRQSQPRLPHSLTEAFANLDKQRTKCDEYLKTLGNHSIFLMNCLQADDLVVFLGSESLSQLHRESKAWHEALIGALNRKAMILFIQSRSQTVTFKSPGRLQFRNHRNTTQSFQEFKSQLQSQVSEPAIVDTQIDHYLIDSLPFSLPGFSVSLFGTTLVADEQMVLRCCIRLPGDRFGASILYPSYAPLLKFLESQVYLTLMSQRKTLVKSWKAANGKKKKLLSAKVKLNQSVVELFDGQLVQDQRATA